MGEGVQGEASVWGHPCCAGVGEHICHLHDHLGHLQELTQQAEIQTRISHTTQTKHIHILYYLHYLSLPPSLTDINIMLTDIFNSAQLIKMKALLERHNIKSIYNGHIKYNYFYNFLILY